MKKFIAALFLTLCAFAVCVAAGDNGQLPLIQTAEADTCGNYTYDVIDGSYAELTGTVSPVSGEIVIPATLNGYPVRSIGAGAFALNDDITKVSFAGNTTVIGEGAFSSCYNLASVTFSDKLVTIDEYAFFMCENLTNINLPESLEKIGQYAFFETGLQSVTVPEKITVLDEWVFTYCGYLTDVTLPEGLKTIGQYAFLGCGSLDSFHIPSTVETIGESAFACCSSLTSLTVPDSVKTIGKYAFADCRSLESLTVPFIGANGSADTQADEHLFGNFFGTEENEYCMARTQSYYDTEQGDWFDKTVYIPKSLKTVTVTGGYITDNAFQNCADIETIVCGEKVRGFGNDAFSGCTSLKSVNIPDGVESIGEYAFENCKKLESVSVPASVTEIGEGAFCECSGLKNIEIKGNISWLHDDTFTGCAAIETLVLPDSITGIGMNTFMYCKIPDNFEIPEKVSYIGVNAFCLADISKITVPASVTEIEEEAFAEIENASIEFLGDKPEFHKDTFKNTYNVSVYYRCNNATWSSVKPSDFNYVTKLTFTVAHTFTKRVEKEQYIKKQATCTTKAVYYKSCAYCGLSSKDTDYAATFLAGTELGHLWGSGVWQKNTGCTTQGEIVYECTRPGCTEKKIVYKPAYGHQYIDGSCMYCGEPDPSLSSDSSADCSCNCHKGGFSGFIWKILCFFYKLFGMEDRKTCACGVSHW